MELTAVAFVAILSLVPAHFFQRFHYLTRSVRGRRLDHFVDLRPFFQSELHNLLIDGFPISIALLLGFVPAYIQLAKWCFLGPRVLPLSSVRSALVNLLLALSPQTPAAALKGFHTWEALSQISVIFLLLVLFSAIAGYLTGWLRWNWIERVVQTIPNKWFYVFLPAPPRDPRASASFVILEILSKVERPSGFHCIYRGRLKRFLVGDAGEPAVLILTDVERAEVRTLPSGEVLHDEHFEVLPIHWTTLGLI